MKLRDASMEVYEKNFYTSHILFHVFSQNASRLFLSKSLWKCASTISFTILTIHLSLLSSCWLWHLMFSWVQFLSNKLESFVSCNIKLLLCILICTFFIKTYLFSIMVIIIFCYDICIKFTLLTIVSTIISTRKEW